MTLHQNKTAIDAARCLYYLHARFYNEPVIDFERLPVRAKHLWVERAAAAIEAVGPHRPQVVTFNTARIGQWGDSA